VEEKNYTILSIIIPLDFGRKQKSNLLVHRIELVETHIRREQGAITSNSYLSVRKRDLSNVV
jgi:hypothetical protein